MKKHLNNIILVLISLLALSSASCRSQKEIISETREQTEQTTDSVSRQVTKTTRVWTTPQATAKLNITPLQLAELPKGAIFQNKQGNATATAKVADDGTIEITANCDSLTLLVENLEIEVYRLQKENKALVTNINKEKTVVLSGWQNFQIWCGRIALGLLTIFIGYKIIKRKWQRN